MFWRRIKTPEIYLLTDDIAIGPQPNKRDWPAIRELGFRGVVDLRDEAQEIGALVRSHELHYMRAPIAEGAAPTVDELYEITGWVNDHILTGESVLVYCRDGRGRSATVAVASLVRLGLPILAASRILLDTRPNAMITRRQMNALEAFTSSIQSTNLA